MNETMTLKRLGEIRAGGIVTVRTLDEWGALLDLGEWALKAKEAAAKRLIEYRTRKRVGRRQPAVTFPRAGHVPRKKSVEKSAPPESGKGEAPIAAVLSGLPSQRVFDLTVPNFKTKGKGKA